MVERVHYVYWRTACLASADVCVPVSIGRRPADSLKPFVFQFYAGRGAALYKLRQGWCRLVAIGACWCVPARERIKAQEEQDRLESSQIRFHFGEEGAPPEGPTGSSQGNNLRGVCGIVGTRKSGENPVGVYGTFWFIPI